MRGKHGHRRRCRIPRRLIPAHAGKTARAMCGHATCAAHPRACGENGNPVKQRYFARGSSPRMRGKRFHRLGRGLGRRLIPAHAGKTQFFALAMKVKQAHPRACGENCVNSGAPKQRSGSSPRMRGKPRRSLRIDVSTGLIPAHAGKTQQALLLPRLPRAHPRACGENAASAAREKEEKGSSPRMRGKPKQSCFIFSCEGLIPAHAGKTSIEGTTLTTGRAHPRACGENFTSLKTLPRSLGSSPRMRGKRLSRLYRGQARGLIPAHAGKTKP